ncbi:LppM family (lipo)protein [Demequina sediminicola]|uniref:LppM family (lipo)protein n=1 Tax=Demequina sediminicola TaxID=1095026 RepID=UPI000781B31C|nr:hypothetical protein [Demequina sediminicola]
MSRVALRYGTTAIVAAVALTGCVRATADTTFSEDGTFSQTAIVAYEDSVASEITDRLGADVDAVVGDLEVTPEFIELQEEYPGQVELVEYSDGDLNGLKLTMTDLPLDVFSDTSSEVLGSVGASASAVLEDGEYTVTFAGPGDEALQLMALGESQLTLLESAVDVSATFTFPGEVTSATAGEIDGNSVTLGLAELITTPEIRITAETSEAFPWGPVLTWLGVIAGFVIVIGGATALVIQDRRARNRSTLPPPKTAPPASTP